MKPPAITRQRDGNTVVCARDAVFDESDNRCDRRPCSLETDGYCSDGRSPPLGTPWRWLGLGALVGVTAMCVATVLFAVPLLIAAALLAQATWMKRAVAVTLLLAGLAAGTSPAWLHNRFVAHEPVFLSAHGRRSDCAARPARCLRRVPQAGA